MRFVFILVLILCSFFARAGEPQLNLQAAHLKAASEKIDIEGVGDFVK